MQTQLDDTFREQDALQKEQAYIRKLLRSEEDEGSSSDTGISTQEGYGSSCEELEDDLGKKQYPTRKTDKSNDGGYISSSDEDNFKKSVSFVIDLPMTKEKILSSEEAIQHHKHQIIPVDFQKIIDGASKHLPNNYSVPIDEIPAWVDKKKFKAGQEFAKKYYFGINYAEMLSLFILFASPNGVQPLIFSGNSSSPFTAFRRYLSTVLRVKSWYEEDVWNKDTLGFRNLKTVRALHLNISKRLNTAHYDELKTQLSLWDNPNTEAVWSTLTTEIQNDYRSGCPFQQLISVKPLEQSSRVFVSQYDMSITQYGFFGLMIMYPQKFGAAGATEEELEGFVHLWKCLGYLLGIEDKYNFCNGTYQDVLQRCHYYTNTFVKPLLQNVNEDWEHMSRCMIEGLSFYIPGVSFETSMMYLAWVLDVPAAHLATHMSWWQTWMFYVTKFTMTFTLWLPGMNTFHNWLICRNLARTANMKSDQLKKLEDKTYDFTKIGKCKSHL